MKAVTGTAVSRVSALILADDLTCFAVFGLLGLRSHGEGLTLANFARAVLPFSLAWLVMATILGALRRMPAPDPLVRRVLVAWLPAWAAGLAARILVFGRSFVPAFAVVSLVVPALFLLGWRSAFFYLGERNRI
jgi:DUF3054 family protein